jgi:hypothetical protein
LQANVENVLPLHWELPHDVVVPGKTQLVRLMPSHRPPHVPLPAQGVRGVVTATQVPRLPALAHDSHWPVHALLQHTPSTHRPFRHWAPFEQAAPRAPSALHVPWASSQPFAHSESPTHSTQP